MYIKKLQVFNYKSYYDSGEMEFSPGINIIVGRNNAGKTSLLEVLTLDFEDHPHRSIKILPLLSSKTTEESRAEISLLFDKEELVNLINQLPHPLGITFPNYNIEEWWNYGEPEQQAEVLVKWFQEVLDNPPIELKLSLYGKPQTEGENKIIIEKFFKYDFKYYDPAPKNKNKKIRFVPIKYVNENKFSPLFEYYYDEDNYTQTTGCEFFEGNIEQTIDYQIFNIFKNRIYRFKAERLNIGICKFENLTNLELKSDASNLAEVLFRLNSENRGMFDYFTELVSSILPEIKSITVALRDNSDLEILVWNKDSIEHRRGDLAIPLSSCGSGVSQVLAIIYILVSSIHEPRTIIIDEPQSFLHPGAARKLIETIKQFPQHQYFIATHSPDIITTADPSNIIKLKYENCQTTASTIDTKEIESQNEILEELGIRLSDVFGADNILWVEGKTEQICFPLILEKVLKKQLIGTKILGVINTADFEVRDNDKLGKRASLIFDIYQKLSEGSNLFSPAIGFLFDREDRTEEDKEKWQKISQKPVEFLSRRMYENYLLDSEAIAEVFNKDNQSRQEPLPINLTTEEVEKWLEKKKQEKGCSEKEWLSEVHGSQLLTDLFREFSGSKLKFHKTRKGYNHSYKLTKWLVENKPDFLSGLAEEVAKMLKIDHTEN